MKGAFIGIGSSGIVTDPHARRWKGVAPSVPDSFGHSDRATRRDQTGVPELPPLSGVQK